MYPRKILHSLAVFVFFTSSCGPTKPARQNAREINTHTEINSATTSKAPAQDLTNAETELLALNAEFEPSLLQVADNVHVTVGYGASVFTFIEGDDGIILIDAGQLPNASAAALEAYREISGKPLAAIILTHSHGDHINGAAPFLCEDTKRLNNFQVWGSDNFGGETKSFKNGGITINRARAVRQAGFRLPPEKRINNGIAPAVYPSGDSFNPADAIKLTHTISGRKEVTISGVTLILEDNSGETSDQILVWYPGKKIAFAGDNFYQSWPNPYAIRGTAYRDVKAWIAAIDKLRALKSEILVGGHTRPIIGKQNVEKTLTTYHDGVSYIFNKTIEGINLGLDPDEIVEFAKLPPELEKERVLRPYYGNPDWAVRSIFNGYLGWFDGNPTNLFPLTPASEAQRMITLAGGRNNVISAINEAIATADYQWASQLADYLLAVDKDNVEAMTLKAQALDRLARKNVTTLARNYYFTSAQELRARADKIQETLK